MRSRLCVRRVGYTLGFAPRSSLSFMTLILFIYSFIYAIANYLNKNLKKQDLKIFENFMKFYLFF